MMKVHIWLRKKAEMSEDEFRRYWLNNHAPIAGDGYAHLQSYVVHLVTRVPEGQERPYDGVATLSWEDRDGFKADMASDTADVSTKDLSNFTDGFGLLFVEEHIVKG
jgi:uncharacterized protein (TIGR02118 family)